MTRSGTNDLLLHDLKILRDLGYDHLDLQAHAASTVTATEETPAFYERTEDPRGLDDLASVALTCTKCRLSETRTQVVFGTGSSTARLMFVGEAPGRDEDREGKPFVGRAGQLLTDIIKAMKLSRDEVYIANVIKCRPPENRNPEPDELEACHPWILQQIDLIRPHVIVTLGRFALQSLLQKPLAISAARGEWQQLGRIRLMPTYHPAYLLRNPSAKKEVWADMKKVMSELGISVD